MTCDRAGNANQFLETSVYTLSTSLTLGDLLVLFLGGLSVLYVAIGADSMDQIKTLPVCTRVYCKSTWRRSIETVAIVVPYSLRILLFMRDLNLWFIQGRLLLGGKIKTRYMCSSTSTSRQKGDVQMSVGGFSVAFFRSMQWWNTILSYLDDVCLLAGNRREPVSRNLLVCVKSGYSNMTRISIPFMLTGEFP